MDIGQTLPPMTLTATTIGSVNTQDWHGHWVILYFYPKDSTPGCTTEGLDFARNYAKFQSKNALVFGVSRDSMKSHDNFKCKQSFPFELISDEDEALCNAFDVIKMKSMYGKMVRGIERSTFLLDPELRLVKAWRKVSVAGHVDEVFETLTALGA